MKIRIAAAQINTTVGDIKGNIELIKKNIEKSLNYGVDIIAFPELSITGYPPEDLLHNEEFIAKNLNGNGCIYSKEFLGDHWILKVQIGSDIIRVSQKLNNEFNIGDRCIVRYKSEQIGFLFPGAIGCYLT